MHYNYQTLKTQAVTLRKLGKTLQEIEKALKLTTGIIKDMTKEVALTAQQAEAAVKRQKTEDKKISKRPS